METDYINIIGKNKIPDSPGTPVAVAIICDESGRILPQYILWNNSKKYRIDSVTNIKHKSNKEIIYYVIIRGKRALLSHIGNVWYVKS